MSSSEKTLDKIYSLFFSYFRAKRMRKFTDLLKPAPGIKILDVGGTAYNWQIFDFKALITLLNIQMPEEKVAGFNYVQGDGRKLDYGDDEFELVFSNSVIEHVGSYADQMQFAEEVRRVAKKIWVQTPARAFFFEPHWLVPFIHWLPINLQRKLAKHFTLRGWLSTPEYVDELLHELRLLTFKEMQQLFPDCEILVERFLGMSKAYIAVRR